MKLYTSTNHGHSLLSLFLFSLIASSSTLVSAASQLTLTSTGCAAPADFDKCMSTASSQASQCYSKNCNNQNGACDSQNNCYSSDENCIGACVCVAYQSWINCALSSCWNKAYSCEFQQLVISAYHSCSLAQGNPPYYPPPASGQGTCSCQMELLYSTIRASTSLATICQTNIQDLRDSNQITGTQHDQYLIDCSCCAASHAESALSAICPSTDPSSMPFYSSVAALQAAQSVVTNKACTSPLSTASTLCAGDPLDFSLPNQGQLHGPADMPNPGSQSISNLAGSLTTPISATLVWSLGNGMIASTAVASSLAAKASAAAASSSSKSQSSASQASGASASGSGTVTSNANVVSTGTSAGTAASSSSSTTSSTHNAASTLSKDIPMLQVICLLVGTWVAMDLYL